MKITSACFLSLVLSFSLCAAEFALHGNYGDHMVLQRDRPIRISGVANPGEKISVSFAGVAGEQGTAEAGATGEWLVELPKLAAGGPYTITVANAARTITVKDVLIGEVWMCCGQSNMHMPLWSAEPFWRNLQGDEVVQHGMELPLIRLFNVTKHQTVSLAKPQGEPIGVWELPEGGALAGFSAVGYFFGRQLYRDLQVPIGLVHTSLGGMPIRSFISAEAFRKAGYTDVLEHIQTALSAADNQTGKNDVYQAQYLKRLAAWEKQFRDAETQADKDTAAQWMAPALDESAWQNLAADPKETFFLDLRVGIAWFRTAVDIPAEWSGQELVLSLGPIDEVDDTYFNGVKVGHLGFEVPIFWEAPRTYTIPAELVKGGRAVIAIRVLNSAGASGLTGLADIWYLARKALPDQRIRLDQGWKYRTECTIPEKFGSGRPELPTRQTIDDPSQPTTLFNAMLAPWRRYPMRGEIWYQGEADAGNPEGYSTLQQLMVQDRRAQWHDDNYAFLWCQLSGFQNHQPDHPGDPDFWKHAAPNDNPAWAPFRFMQQKLLQKIPLSGMAVTIDRGNAYDIHPHDKEIVAFRLAREAERICYGFQGVTAGPYYRSMEIKGSEIILHFDNVGAGLISTDGQPLGSFAIAGADGKFVWAAARIVGDTVVVSSPAVPAPAQARYGWVSYAGNLNFGNANGFPASPFTTK